MLLMLSLVEFVNITCELALAIELSLTNGLAVATSSPSHHKFCTYY